MNLIPLCSMPRAVIRDGRAGPQAHLIIPGYGFWYADGKVYNFPRSQIPQDQSQVLGGTYQTLSFKKSAGVCIVPGPNLTPTPAA